MRKKLMPDDLQRQRDKKEERDKDREIKKLEILLQSGRPFCLI